jgi:hypothetical protein
MSQKALQAGPNMYSLSQLVLRLAPLNSNMPIGRIIVGVAKEKSEAAQAFQSALDAGRTAGLVEWVTDDSMTHKHIDNPGRTLTLTLVFTISVGSIPARQKVTARLTVSELRRYYEHII